MMARNFPDGRNNRIDRLCRDTLKKYCRTFSKREIALSGTSRTDAGVHARGQKASFRTDINIPTERLALVINNILCGYEKGAFALSPVKIVSAEERPLDFHARFDSKGKKYIYRIRNSKETDIFMRNYMYHVAAPLDMDAMKTAAGYIVGTHDFKSFEASGGTPRETTVRTIFDIDIKENIYRIDNVNDGDIGRDIELHVSGDGFLYNMVRIITGTFSGYRNRQDSSP